MYPLIGPAVLFQSTLPREERRDTRKTHDTSRKFQSTLPREERLIVLVNIKSQFVFQSTLPREERRALRLPP